MSFRRPYRRPIRGAILLALGCLALAFGIARSHTVAPSRSVSAAHAVAEFTDIRLPLEPRPSRTPAIVDSDRHATQKPPVKDHTAIAVLATPEAEEQTPLPDPARLVRREQVKYVRYWPRDPTLSSLS
jgi:hypothetical protein